ncbi:hypothetical protein ABAC460_12620 [Asticcacaulis sp. AC460]|uniref:hypothetical protein n=1 Tax=Asticcacaulis sp. AC460 TaxID=1282360 RepID=UPI0003C3ECCA|nr:hypothetical protein [Asticcacaulis sp. AC460]ESQ89704.1 hypothetical protein ABAC460_12620 [Asticcacaulis sp. AC460]
MRTILATLCGLLLSGAALAADLPAPPSPMVDPHAGPFNPKGPAVDRFALGAFQHGFGKDKLQVIAKSLGVGSVRELGGAYYQYLCYDLPERRERVWLATFDEMGEGGVDAVTVKSLTSGDAPAGTCPALPAKFQPVVISGKVRLGVTRADLVALYGKPGLETGGWLVFGGGGEGWRTSITVRLQNDKVVFLYAENTSTD